MGTMKKTGMLLGFIPLIIYGILSSLATITLALTAAVLFTLLFGWRDLRNGMILSWAGLALFGCALVAVGILGATWINPFLGTLIYATLAAVTFGSILAGIPFTLQYAREMVDTSLWENPFFIRVNVLMTGVWGGVFLVNTALSAAMIVLKGITGTVLQGITYGILIAGIIFTLWYPGHIRKKREPGAVHDSALTNQE
jgi:hypothetical protein